MESDRETMMHSTSAPGEGFLGSKEVVAVKQAETNLNSGRRIPTWKEAVIAATVVLIITFVISLLIYDWVSAAGLAIFMAVFTGVLVVEGSR